MDKSYLNPFAELQELADTCLRVLGLDLACQYLRNSGYTNIRDAKGDELGVICKHGDMSMLVSIKVFLGEGEGGRSSAYSGGVWFGWHKRPDGSPDGWPQCVLSRHGEAIACQLLEGLGYEITHQDLILMEEQEEPWSIVDIVAKDPDSVPDCECEYDEKVQMAVAAKKYLEEHPDVNHVRHDYVAVLLLDDG